MDFLLIGDASLPSWPLLNMGFVKEKIRIASGATMTVRHLVIGDFRSGLITQAPGFDLAAPTLLSTPTSPPGLLLHQETVVLYSVCFPKPVWTQALGGVARPPQLPGNQTFLLSTPQDGCVNASATQDARPAPALLQPPLASRCWADAGRILDMGFVGADADATGRLLPNNYNVWLTNVTYLCANTMNVPCIQRFAPYGCAVGTIANSTVELPWRLPPLGGAAGVMRVRSGRDLALAFVSSPHVHTAVLVNDVWAREADWAGLLPASRAPAAGANSTANSTATISTTNSTNSSSTTNSTSGGNATYEPWTLTRNFTIMSDPSLPSWPLLNMGFVKAKIRIAAGVTLLVRHVIIGDFRSGLLTQAPGFDLAAPTLLPTPTSRPGLLLHNETMVLYGVCFPKPVWSQALGGVARPPQLPGNQTFLLSRPQDGCVNATSTNTSTSGAAGNNTANTTGLLQPPLPNRCWSDAGIFPDMAFVGADADATNRLLPNHYNVWLNSVGYLCANTMSLECIRTYQPYGCAVSLINKTLGALPWDAPLSAESGGGADSGGDSGSSSSDNTALTVGLAVGLGGAALLAVIAVAVVMVRRRRQARGGNGGGGWLGGGKAAEAGTGGITPSSVDGAGKSNGIAGANADGADGSGCADVLGSGGSIAGKGQLQTQGLSTSAAPTPSCGSHNGPASAAPSGRGPRSGGPSAGHGAGSVGLEDSRGGSDPLADSAAGGGSSGAGIGLGDAAASLEMGLDGLGGLGAAGGVRQRPPSSIGTDAHAGSLLTDAGTGSNGTSREGAARSRLLQDEHMVVTPLTPPRADLAMGEAAVNEVVLLPVVRGKGAFGRVYEGMYQGERVAVKVMRDMADQGTPPDHIKASFTTEVEVLARCQHPNVVKLLAACVQPPKWILVMELMETSLEKLVYGKAPHPLMPLPQVLSIALDVAKGLEYLHPTILHRDLKPANILINNAKSDCPLAKITDFGVSRLRSTVLITKHPEAGTPAYMAPETFDVANYTLSHHVDMYSFGVLVWVMLTGQHPWQGLTMVEVAYKVTINRERLPLATIPQDRAHPRILAMINQCWEHEPRRRPAASEVVKELQMVMESMSLPLHGGGTSGLSSASSNSMLHLPPSNQSSRRFAPPPVWPPQQPPLPPIPPAAPLLPVQEQQQQPQQAQQAQVQQQVAPPLQPPLQQQQALAAQPLYSGAPQVLAQDLVQGGPRVPPPPQQQTPPPQQPPPPQQQQQP
ncbi:hypothetical protein HXX76_002242 [Chlamydomonas incerta]|uniref:Protein kinase domain-containing protein n=1 Tax=Chlamydomonas incerta TaxID=51695 RepID=A0A836B0H3_CHLIN|nr:hypothetical protein HXX76_002242 [Chlamydomonas incerta]|eukprot:KAG2443902.1 hypothetical protein HXX76_002242 [Chlamydomonas incerta]